MENKKKKTFIFNIGWKDVLSDQPSEVRLEVYEAIISYADTNEVPKLTPVAAMAFSFIKREMDKNNQKYAEIIAKRSEAGKKGMASRYRKYLTNDNKDNKRYHLLGDDNKRYQEITNVTDNDISNDISNKERDITDVISPKSQKTESIDWTGFMQYFNETFAGKLPAIKTITKARKEAVRARIAEYGKESVRDVYKAILESDFLLGHNDKNWRADFDWIFRPTNYIKIIEGKYKNLNHANNHESNRGTYTSKEEANNYALEQLMRRREEIERGVADETPKPF